MHWNLEQIVWAVLLAAHLVLLVVLLGKDRASRFPWFTAVLALSAIRLLADHLLNAKLTTLAFYWQSFSGMALDWILGVVVLVELARHIFSSGRAGLVVNRRGWLGWSLVTVGLALAAIWFWGPWPTWQALAAEHAELPLLLLVLGATKGQLFISILTVEVVLVFQIFGRRFGAGWRSHAQQIALGLSTNALAFLALQGITEYIKRTVDLRNQDKYQWAVHVITKSDSARHVVWILVVCWWIVWLWKDEAGGELARSTAEEEPMLAETPTLESETRDSDMDDEMNFRD